MKFTLAALVPVVLALSVMGSPVELDIRQQQAPKCNLAGCLLTIGSNVPGIINPCLGAADKLRAIQQAEAQGKPPSASDQASLATGVTQCILTSVSAGLGIPNACNGCPGAPA